MSRRPWFTLLALAVVTAGMLQGFGVAEETAEVRTTEAFLPSGSPLARARDALAADFPMQAGLSSIQIVFRGDVLSPEGLRESYEAVEAVAADRRVAPLLAGAQPVLSPGHLVRMLADGRDPGEMSRLEIAGMVAAAAENPEAEALVGAIASLTGSDDAGAVVGGLGLVNVFDPGDPEVRDAAEYAARDLIAAFDTSTLSASTVSPALVAAESDDTIAGSTPILMAMALAVIVVILALFYRTLSDVALSLAGLGLTIGWTLGLQGLLGPGGIGLIGGLDTFDMVVPVVLIGLSVDFALHITGRYRDSVAAGEPVAGAMEGAVTGSAMAILLAAGTTAVAFLTNITNSIPPIRSFGVVAAAGVLCGMLVMSSFVPAARTLVDRRRERRGLAVRDTSLDEAFPGLGPLVGQIAGVMVKRPLVVLALVAAITAAAGYELGSLESTFDQTELLPSGEVLDDIEFLQRNLGGRSEVVTVLVEADLSSDRTLRDLVDLELALVDDNRRPTAVSGPVFLSLVTLIRDWSEPSGLPGDDFDPAFRDFLEELDTGLIIPPEVVDSVYDELRTIDPEGLAAVAAFHDYGPDATIVQFPARTGNQDVSRRMIGEIERLWFGDDAAITTLGGEILSVSVTDELADSQRRGVLITVGVTLILLMLFFGFTQFRPVLGVFAVLPIAAVLIWVLGSMVVLGISYNAVTALITALTIGVGVDYTIHLTHRFLEERQKTRSVTVAMRTAMHTTGGALIGSAMTTAFGFAVLLFAPLGPMRQFGILTALTILFSLAAAFVILPPTLTLWATYHRWRAQAFSDDPERVQHAEPVHRYE